MFSKKLNGFQFIFLTGSILFVANIHAAEWAENTTISGFSSAVFQKSDSNVSFGGDHDAGVSSNGSFSGTRFGININSQINDKISLASQLISTKDHDQYATKIDWAFVSYEINDSLSFRSGKVKYPVGLVNEYVSVGYAFPWITPPKMFYSLSANGPQVTREAYTGASLLWAKSIGEMSYTIDLYGGEVALEQMTVHGMKGITVTADWDDAILVQVSSFNGKMENENLALMDGEIHSSNVIGVKADLDEVVAYAEYASVDMGAFTMGNSTAWYGSLGYRMDEYLPYLNFAMYERGKDAKDIMPSAYNKQYVGTAGIKYDILPQADIKFELTRVHTSAGKGLYETSEANADVNIIGVAIDVVF